MHTRPGAARKFRGILGTVPPSSGDFIVYEVALITTTPLSYPILWAKEIERERTAGKTGDERMISREKAAKKREGEKSRLKKRTERKTARDVVKWNCIKANNHRERAVLHE